MCVSVYVWVCTDAMQVLLYIVLCTPPFLLPPYKSKQTNGHVCFVSLTGARGIIYFWLSSVHRIHERLLPFFCRAVQRYAHLYKDKRTSTHVTFVYCSSIGIEFWVKQFTFSSPNTIQCKSCASFRGYKLCICTYFFRKILFLAF